MPAIGIDTIQPFTVPNVSTCKLTDGPPRKTANGPAKSERSAARTDWARGEGPATMPTSAHGNLRARKNEPSTETEPNDPATSSRSRLVIDGLPYSTWKFGNDSSSTFEPFSKEGEGRLPELSNSGCWFPVTCTRQSIVKDESVLFSVSLRILDIHVKCSENVCEASDIWAESTSTFFPHGPHEYNPTCCRLLPMRIRPIRH